MRNKLNLKEIVVLAMISVLMGVVFLGLDSVYQPLQAIAGPLGGDILYGTYLISALLSMYLIRKPGAALTGSLYTGIVNLLMGSPYGIHIIVACLLQGLGVEIGVGITKYKFFTVKTMALSAILAMLMVTARDYFVFGFAYYENLVPIMIGLRCLSSLIFGVGLTIAISNGLKNTGVLSGFMIASEEI